MARSKVVGQERNNPIKYRNIKVTSLHTFQNAFLSNTPQLRTLMDDYHHTYNGDQNNRRFFSETRLKDWSFNNFKEYISRKTRNLPGSGAMRASYKVCLANIKDDLAVPEQVRKKVEDLLKEV